ncbi:MAG TPA: hypothetical protein VIQ54_15275, partial [Polyangia bacterium]
MSQAKRQVVAWAIAISILPAACATRGGASAGGVPFGDVVLTPAPDEEPVNFLLAAQVATGSGPQPVPRLA